MCPRDFGTYIHNRIAILYKKISHWSVLVKIFAIEQAHGSLQGYADDLAIAKDASSVCDVLKKILDQELPQQGGTLRLICSQAAGLKWQNMPIPAASKKSFPRS